MHPTIFALFLIALTASSVLADSKPQGNAPTLSEQLAAIQLQLDQLKEKIGSQGVNTDAMIANGSKRRMTPMGSGGAAGNQQNAMGGMMQMMPQMMPGMMQMMSSMMGGMSGMGGMAQPAGPAAMGQTSAQQLLSALPGYPGATHLYHVGSTGFFLDHPEHITLSLEQQNRLSALRTKALLARSDSERKIQAAEEALWLLTAADQPNLRDIETKIREIEKLRSDARLAFIKHVGEATTLLTDQQRRALLGTSATAQPPKQQNMGDM